MPSALLPEHFFHGDIVFRIAHRKVVPIDRIYGEMLLVERHTALHVRNSFAEGGLRQQHDGSFGRLSERLGDLLHRMSIDRKGAPAESGPAFRKIGAIEN